MKIFRLFSILTLVALAHGESLPFRQAVDLAVKRSTLISATEQMKAHENYLAAKRLYIPQVNAGSGLAENYGFPLSIEGSAPAVVSVNGTGYLINFGQREIVRAAHTEWDATAFTAADRRQQAILDAAVTYIQLDRMITALHLLRQQEQEAAGAGEITAKRVQAGIAPQLELTRAALATARVRVTIAQVEGNIDVLRNLLSQLTGVAAPGIETVTESIPQLPDVRQDDDLASRAASSNPAVKLAFAHADAKQSNARAEHRQLLPTIDLVGQYGLFSSYNNYQRYFLHFQRNNGILGVAIHVPLLNLSQRARAAVADAEVVQARREAEDAKNKVSNETRKLQHDVAHLAAAREVARLEYQLARADVDTVQTKVQAGTATLRDEADARLAEGQKYSAYLNASSQLEQTQMQLMRSTGDLEKWALAGQ